MAQTQSTQIAAVTAGTDFAVDLLVVPTDVEEYTVGKISVVSPVAITAQGGTNFNTLTVKQYTAGVAGVTLGSINFGTTALVADTPVTITAAGKDLSASLSAGDVIRATYTHTGTGANQVAVEVSVELPG